MGMTLVARNEQTYDLNWTAWHILETAIWQANYPVRLANANDGDRLDAQACKGLASFIRSNVPLLYRTTIEYYRQHAVIDAQTLEPANETLETAFEFWSQLADFLEACNGCEQW